MVRRLVEQQQVGLREQQRGERDAHLPAARKAVERAALHLLVEAEADAGCARRGRARYRRRSRSAARGSRRAGRDRGCVSLSSSTARRARYRRRARSRTAWRSPCGRFLRDIADAACRAACRRCRRRARAGPSMTFISVDLPAPLRPISPTRLRGGSAAVARSRIVRPPRRTVMPLRLSMARAVSRCSMKLRGRQPRSFSLTITNSWS